MTKIAFIVYKCCSFSKKKWRLSNRFAASYCLVCLNRIFRNTFWSLIVTELGYK